jgi:hypothetical protein
MYEIMRRGMVQGEVQMGGWETRHFHRRRAFRFYTTLHYALLDEASALYLGFSHAALLSCMHARF